MTKKQISPQQLGEILFIFALETTLDNLKNKEIVKNLNIEKTDEMDLLREMIIINMFGTLLALQKTHMTDNYDKILDFMHKTYDETLTKKLEYNREYIEIAHEHIKTRYKEYLQTKQTNDTNWLFPLASKMINNLRGQKTENITATMHLIGLFSTFIEVVSGLIKKYEIIQN